MRTKILFSVTKCELSLITNANSPFCNKISSCLTSKFIPKLSQIHLYFAFFFTNHPSIIHPIANPKSNFSFYRSSTPIIMRIILNQNPVPKSNKCETNFLQFLHLFILHPLKQPIDPQIRKFHQMRIHSKSKFQTLIDFSETIICSFSSVLSRFIRSSQYSFITNTTYSNAKSISKLNLISTFSSQIQLVLTHFNLNFIDSTPKSQLFHRLTFRVNKP